MVKLFRTEDMVHMVVTSREQEILKLLFSASKDENNG